MRRATRRQRGSEPGREPCRFRSPNHRRRPRTHLLSNGRYAVMLTAAGSGYSRWRDIAVTRWREDATRDDWGSFVFLRDAQSGKRLVGQLSAVGGEPEPRR